MKKLFHLSLLCLCLSSVYAGSKKKGSQNPNPPSPAQEEATEKRELQATLDAQFQGIREISGGGLDGIEALLTAAHIAPDIRQQAVASAQSFLATANRIANYELHEEQTRWLEQFRARVTALVAAHQAS